MDQMGKSREAPAQTKLKDTITELTRELKQLSLLEQEGIITNIDKEKKEKIQYEIRLSTKALHKLEYQKRQQQKYRSQKKQKLLRIERQFKEADLNTQLIRPTVGHPSLEEQQPDQLQEALTNMNYKLLCSAAYLRLIPRWNNSKEGKRHIKTVPVKLLRSQNSARRAHEVTRFYAALIRNVKEMVSVLGPKSTLVISQDDKALEYRVELPDHDWVVAERHKLIPSVYAILDIQEGKYRQAEAVTYSGPTFIRICSDKHDRSTAYSHSKDFDNLMNEEKLRNYTTTMNEQSKPVVVLISDSGPDENSRYRKTIQMMIEHFDKYDLDTIIVACFAPYQSSSNPVERRIAPLSHDLADVILSHDTFGSHLDAQLRTNDEELEKRNFKAAADILISIWESTIIDSYPVLVKYLDPSDEHYSPSEKSVTWIEKHVMTCRYITQVTKCDDPSCCKPFHSGIRQILLNRFIPPPLVVQQTPYSICAAKLNESDDITHFSSFLLSVLMEGKLTPPDMNIRYLPFDWYCPTVNKSINEFICSYCNRYFALKRTLKSHTKKCSRNESNLSVEAALEFLVVETMWVEEEAVPEDVLETYHQQVQVQEELIANKVLIVNWDTWKKYKWTNK
ncbi:11521_t:CDS:2 [Dentiscutata erythropus]|uniref:11521_t:CDS:1 n=1 Tax=Dentiscutata erythropus TaxID=1348616 RepID=A0A9N9BT10_9GLOM|nr:11521_t:CDS:2 [Dentiscutata erythropus]